MKSTARRFALTLALLTACGTNAQAQDTADTTAAQGSTAATQEETNVATTAMGANGLKVQGDAVGLDAVLAEEDGASAQLTPAGTGGASTVIDLAGTVNLSRVLLEVGQTPGRLVIVGMTETGEQVDLSTPEGVSKLIADRQLDGTESVIALDVSQLAVKAVMIYWEPAEVGQPLTLKKVGIFTKDAVEPPTTTGELPQPPPPPVIPPPEVVAQNVQTYQEIVTSSPPPAPPADAPEDDLVAEAEGSPTPPAETEPAAEPLPEPVPPESRATST